MKVVENKHIYIIWLSLIAELFLISLFKNSITDYESIGFIIIIVHAIFSAFILLLDGSKYSMVLVWALIARLIFMLWDLNAQHIFLLPNAGGDTEIYYGWAKFVADDLNNLTESIRGGFYSKILGIIFHFTGPMRILGQYINVLLGLMVVIFVYRILVLLRVKDNVSKVILLIAAFFPNSLIMSAILLREILPTFLVVVSFYYFIKWYLNKNLFLFICSLVFLALASMFHSGVIGLALGYLTMFLFYNHSTEKFDFSFQNFILFLPVLAFVFLFSTSFGDIIFYKFRTLEEPSDIYDSVKTAAGGSAYLQGMTINNPIQFFLFAPIRAFYFLFSPLPMNWRGAQDVILFFIDSVFYGYVLYYFIRNKKYFLQNKQLIIILVVAILIVSLIYGIGVSNAGTAMRHRQKIVPIFLILLGVMMNEKERIIMLLKQAKLKKLLK